MKRFAPLFCVIALAGLFFGCAQKSANPSNEQEISYNFSDGNENSKVKVLDLAQTKKGAPANPAGEKIVSKAQSVIGTPYVFGGSAPGGFDCSGLVKWSYSHIGVTLPRTAREQSVVGEKINKVEDMKAGDIVAFRHPKRGYHTGIYVGNGKFIHSPRKKTTVRINSLSDRYFSETLLGARRVNLAAGENLVAQAQTRLDELIAEKTKLTVSSSNLRAAAKHKKAAVTTAKNTQKIKQNQAKKNQKTLSQAKNSKKQDKNSKVAKKAASSSRQLANSKVQKTVKTVANTKDAKKKTSAAASKKSSSKTVSMLNKKANTKQNIKRKHS